jgi:tetratricopeptide (TPR) repeat protein
MSKSLGISQVSKYTLGLANNHMLLGEIHLVQGNLNEAESSFKKALELHAMANDGLGQGKDYSGLGRIHIQRGQLHDAKAMFEKAIYLAKKAQDSAAEEEGIMYLNAVISQMKDGGVL